MNRDPFDSLRSRNPVAPESLPTPPTEVARAITAGRPSLRRGLAVAAGAAALVLVGGGSWLLWSRGGAVEMAAEPTTTLAAAVPTTPPASAEETAPVLTVYFLDPDGSTLVPVARDLIVLNARPLPDLSSLALELLLWGPGAWDAGPLPDPVAAAEAALTTAIPEGTGLLSVRITERVAMVDLSAEFAAAPPEAIAQVVFTTTRLDGVDAVRFLIEGAPQYLLAEPLSLTPAAVLPDGRAVIDPATRADCTRFLPPIMIESPPLGGTLTLPGQVTLLTGGNPGEVLLQIVGEDGLPLWSGTVPPCPGCAADGIGDSTVAVPEAAAEGTGWVTLRAYLASFDQGPFAEAPVWLVPYAPSTDEPDLPEATTTTSTTTPPTTAIPSPAAPWSGAPLAATAVPAVARDTWAAAQKPDACPLLFPADPESLAAGAVLHDRYFGGGWGLAWDLPSGPGRWEPGGEYCPDCGREAFGVAGAVGEAPGDADAVWPNRLSWADGSHAGYGYEGVTAGQSGEPPLAYLFVGGRGCLYNVWSFLGEEHLLALIDQLRFVEGMGAP